MFNYVNVERLSMLNTRSEMSYGCNNVTIKRGFVAVTICCFPFSLHGVQALVERKGSTSSTIPNMYVAIWTRTKNSSLIGVYHATLSCNSEIPNQIYMGSHWVELLQTALYQAQNTNEIGRSFTPESLCICARTKASISVLWRKLFQLQISTMKTVHFHGGTPSRHRE